MLTSSLPRFLAQAWLIVAAFALAFGLYHDGRIGEATTHGFMGLTVLGLMLTEPEVKT